MIVRNVGKVARAALLFGFAILLSGLAAAEVPAPQSYGAAMRWYERAAADGNVEAQYLLGLKYERGVEVPADSGKAAHWYARAAAQGHAEAQFRLASMYVRGDGVAADSSLAAQLYEKAAGHGLPAAQYNLGAAYLNGTGVDRDAERALAWISIAAESNLASAIALRDRLRQSLPPDLVEAARGRESELRKKHAI